MIDYTHSFPKKIFLQKRIDLRFSRKFENSRWVTLSSRLINWMLFADMFFIFNSSIPTSRVLDLKKNNLTRNSLLTLIFFGESLVLKSQ